MAREYFNEKEFISLIARFEARKLPKSEWTHEAHLAVAIWYCHNYDNKTALKLVRENITWHNESVGTPNTDYEGYHETITRFWLLVARQFLNRNKQLSLNQVCNEFISSELSSSSYPLTYYSKKCLFSVKARHNWMEPDLKQLTSVE